jgi:hypothetical protein
MYLQVSASVRHCVHVGAQKVSDFGGFRISEFRVRDIQPVLHLLLAAGMSQSA